MISSIQLHNTDDFKLPKFSFFLSWWRTVSKGACEMDKYRELGLGTYSAVNNQLIRWITAIHRCLTFAVWEHRVMTRLFIMPLCLNAENFPGFTSRLWYPLFFPGVPSHIGNYQLPNKWVEQNQMPVSNNMSLTMISKSQQPSSEKELLCFWGTLKGHICR